MNERYSRQKDLVPEKALGECTITVIGVGAIGRQVALQLSAMGAKHLQLIDFDHVEESNIASQAYLEDDLGQPKVSATASMCLKINSQLDLTIRNSRFKKSDKVGNIVFCCVDKIDTRKFVWEATKDHINFFVDGRMSGEVMRILTASITDQKSMEHYSESLFSQDEAHSGSCTAKSTIYCANIAAGLMVSKFAMWLRDIPLEKDVMVNLVSDEMTVQ